MKQHIKHIALAAGAVALAATTSAAHAQSAGNWLVRGGLVTVAPKVKSGELSAPTVPNTRVDVTPDTVWGGGVTYMYTDHFSVDLPLAMPLHNRIVGDGAIKGSGDIARTKSLPATLFAQYRLLDAGSTVRPYVGAGLTYAYFYETTTNNTLTSLTNPGGEPTTMKIRNKLGYTVQAGMTVALGERWFADLMVAKTKLKTSSKLSTGQSIDVTLDPLTTAFYIGYRY